MPYINFQLVHDLKVADEVSVVSLSGTPPRLTDPAHLCSATDDRRLLQWHHRDQCFREPGSRCACMVEPIGPTWKKASHHHWRRARVRAVYRIWLRPKLLGTCRCEICAWSRIGCTSVVSLPSAPPPRCSACHAENVKALISKNGQSHDGRDDGREQHRKRLRSSRWEEVDFL